MPLSSVSEKPNPRRANQPDGIMVGVLPTTARDSNGLKAYEAKLLVVLD
jgi:hypothetical protein